MYHSSTWLLWSSSIEIALWDHMSHKHLHTLPIQSIYIYPFPNLFVINFPIMFLPSSRPASQSDTRRELEWPIHLAISLFRQNEHPGVLLQALPSVVFLFITFRTTPQKWPWCRRYLLPHHRIQNYLQINPKYFSSVTQQETQGAHHDALDESWEGGGNVIIAEMMDNWATCSYSLLEVAWAWSHVYHCLMMEYCWTQLTLWLGVSKYI